jgi:hypothetical protein
MGTIQEKTEALLDAIKDAGLEVTKEKVVFCLCLITRTQDKIRI